MIAQALISDGPSRVDTVTRVIKQTIVWKVEGFNKFLINRNYPLTTSYHKRCYTVIHPNPPRNPPVI